MMKSIILAITLVVGGPVAGSFGGPFAMIGGAANAGPIESACNRSDRKASNRQLCGCIQQVADQTLRGADQRRAATFFKDPEKAHKVWMSKSSGDDAFWERYKAFSAQAQVYCGG